MLFRSKTEMVTADDALPGRDTPIQIAPTHVVLGTPLYPPFPAGSEIVYVAMGCFWGSERIFWQIPGVYTTAVGYMGGWTKNPNYEETCTAKTGHTESVMVVYDPEKVTFDQLMKAFWENHDPTTLNRQGGDVGTQYRSAIFYTTPAQQKIVDAYIAQLTAAKVFKDPIVTEVKPLRGFHEAEAYHQNYYNLHPNQPYIVINDRPKVEALKTQFADLWR